MNGCKDFRRDSPLQITTSEAIFETVPSRLRSHQSVDASLNSASTSHDCGFGTSMSIGTKPGSEFGGMIGSGNRTSMFGSSGECTERLTLWTGTLEAFR
ncbi:hypothetical protein [Glycomyces artemisiae]|uniref:Uncharacterized protein n=1 Tax=Glycomyces artemisiae TaxID=1076443 RepID=A0A2T0URR7_9ACTN|nr:hypothetical protein [Glycomyces artemisiae]PRY60558.1 hypothetical protein B0I28_102163 [Glycomyces artemisiae]